MYRLVAYHAGHKLDGFDVCVSSTYNALHTECICVFNIRE